MKRSSRKTTTIKRRLLAGCKIFNCYYCRKEFNHNKATLEHIIPLSHGGTWEDFNLVLACYECNHKRSAIITKIKVGKFKGVQLILKHYPYLGKHISIINNKYYLIYPADIDFLLG